MALRLPTTFGPYTLQDLIARGGMAEIYRATMPGVGGFEKTVAIKKILPHLAENDEFISMLIDEAQLVVSINHANIAQVFDLGEIQGDYYIAMEYVHGIDLAGIIKELKNSGQTVPLEHAVYIASCVAAGLHVAHNKCDENGRPQNIVHRDVSPHNVLIGFAGEVKIIDFGVAKARGKDANTKLGVIKGKLLYMAPEQAMAKELDGRADLFAAGLILYRMLTNRLPFEGDNEFQIYNNILSKNITPPRAFNPDIPEEVNQIVMMLLQRDPSKRYQDGYSAKVDLDRALQNLAPGYSISRLSRWVEDNFSHLADKKRRRKNGSGPNDAPVSTPSFNPVGTGERRPSMPAAPGDEWDVINEDEATLQVSMNSPEAQEVLAAAKRAREEARAAKQRASAPQPPPTGGVFAANPSGGFAAASPPGPPGAPGRPVGPPSSRPPEVRSSGQWERQPSALHEIVGDPVDDEVATGGASSLANLFDDDDDADAATELEGKLDASFGASPSGLFRSPSGPNPSGQFPAGRSPSGPFAASPSGQFAASPSGQFAASPSGQFAASPSGQYRAPSGEFVAHNTGSFHAPPPADFSVATKQKRSIPYAPIAGITLLVLAIGGMLGYQVVKGQQAEAEIEPAVVAEGADTGAVPEEVPDETEGSVAAAADGGSADAAAEQPEPVPTVELFVESKPAGAQVFYGDELVGETPIKGHPVPKGETEVVLRLEKEGYEPTESRVIPFSTIRKSVDLLSDGDEPVEEPEVEEEKPEPAKPKKTTKKRSTRRKSTKKKSTPKSDPAVPLLDLDAPPKKKKKKDKDILDPFAF